MFVIVVKSTTFVATANKLLIFKEVLNQKEDDYERYKGNEYPNNTSVIFFVQFFVLSVR